MRKLTYWYLPVLVSIISVKTFSQVADITRLPVQNPSQSIKESAPVWISQNEIIIFYNIEGKFENLVTDTIYSTKSTNRGLTWGTPKVMHILEEQVNRSALYLTSLKLEVGRLILSWSVHSDSMKLIYSDDKGESWSQPISIRGYGTPLQQIYSRFLRLSELQDNTVLLSFTESSGQTSVYRKSFDGGLTWTDENLFEFVPDGTLYAIEQVNSYSLIAIYTFNGSVYSRWSNDSGLTWGDSSFIDTLNNINTIPKVVKPDNGSLVIIYDLIQDSLETQGYVSDIYIKESFDGGKSWSDSYRITKYLGDDSWGNITSYENDVCITFFSEREHGIFYGFPGESEDLYTPPVVISSGVGEVDYENEKFQFQANVIDDEDVSKVIVKIEEINFEIELYDDGIHNDELPNDNIFGNVLPFVTPANDIDAYVIDVNKITLPLNRSGVLADVDISSLEIGVVLEMTDVSMNVGNRNLDINVPNKGVGGYGGGKYDESSFLYAGGFILSGYSNGELWSNAVASAMLVEDYNQGNVGGNEYDPRYVLYIVNKRDPPFGYTWQNWRDAVTLGAEFYDGDGDGTYNPVDKNWNGTWETNEDMPMLIGDETIWCVYNDGVPANQRRWESESQGIEIRQTVFASSQPELENVLFIKYSLLNIGVVTDVMDTVYFAIWQDADLGDHSDDVVGCDSLLNSGFYYNRNPDGLYGENCPAFFTTFLQGPIIQTSVSTDTAQNNYGNLIGSENISGAKNLDMTTHTFFIGGDPWIGNANDVTEARNYLEGKNRIGEYPDPCDFPYCEVRGSVNCNEIDPHFWASGDPVTDIGWLSLMRVDHRNLISTGPFKLEKDKPQEIIIAYVMGRGTDYFNSITAARENVRRAIEEYESNFASITYSPPPPTNPVTSYVLYQNYPNPFNPITTIRYELPEDGVVTIDIYDILGQRVKTILNEFQKADGYEVDFNAAGLASGVYIYRMKVNDFITSKKMILIR